MSQTKSRKAAASKRPRSLVTGACGFMGTHMLEVLHEAGHEIVATDLESATREDDRKLGRFPSVARKLGIALHPSDMRDRKSLEPLTADLDYVFHIASVFNYSAPWSLLESVNVGGTRHLVELVQANSPKLERFVLWGAGGVYGLPAYRSGPYTEDMPPAPPNDYLRAKWFQEHYVIEKGRTDALPYAIMRPTSVYGPRGVYGTGPLLMQPAEMKVVAAPRSFTEHIPFVHVRDVCEAALYLATTEAARGRIFNLTDDTDITTFEFMQFVAEVTGHRFVALPAVPFGPIKAVMGVVAHLGKWAKGRGLPIDIPLEKDTVDYMGIDFRFSNAALHGIGYKFRYPDARVGIRETLEWYRSEGWIQY